jgi:hypothetical protein
MGNWERYNLPEAVCGFTGHLKYIQSLAQTNLAAKGVQIFKHMFLPSYGTEKASKLDIVPIGATGVFHAWLRWYNSISFTGIYQYSKKYRCTPMLILAPMST